MRFLSQDPPKTHKSQNYREHSNTDSKFPVLDNRSNAFGLIQNVTIAFTYRIILLWMNENFIEDTNQKVQVSFVLTNPSFSYALRLLGFIKLDHHSELLSTLGNQKQLIIQIPHLPEYETNFSFILGYLKTQESSNTGILTKFHAAVNDFTLPTIICMECFDEGFCDCM